MQQVKNPKCEPDEYGIKYLPVMRQAMCIEGRKVGRTAANEDKRIDVLLTEVMEKVGKEGLFIIYVLKNPKVLINENKISKKIVKQAIGPICYKQPLFIIAEDVEVEVAGSLILDRICVSTKFCLVKPPEFEENCKGIMQDLAVLTGGWVVTAESNSLLARLKLGSCKEVVILDNEMVILGGSGSQADIEKRCEQLRSAIKASTSDYEIKLLEERLLNLSCGALIVKVTGGSTKNKRIVNALNAVKAAMEDGIIPGGGVVLFHASKELDKLQTTSLGGKIGVQLLQQALKMPVCTIASATGVDGSAVAEKLLEQDNPDVGYDPARGEYVDVIKLGIFDPLKLVIKELDDAISYFITHCWCSYEMLQRQNGKIDGMGGS